MISWIIKTEFVSNDTGDFKIQRRDGNENVAWKVN